MVVLLHNAVDERDDINDVLMTESSDSSTILRRGLTPSSAAG